MPFASGRPVFWQINAKENNQKSLRSMIGGNFRIESGGFSGCGTASLLAHVNDFHSKALMIIYYILE